jgi:hypothetical protein
MPLFEKGNPNFMLKKASWKAYMVKSRYHTHDTGKKVRKGLEHDEELASTITAKIRVSF